MVTLYHGSNRLFTQFEIDAKWVRTPHSSLVEGMGIYFTESPTFARSYGDYVYEVDVEDDHITDFTNKETIMTLLDTIAQKIDFPLCEWLDTSSFVRSVQEGHIAVTTLYEEINLLLDSQEALYTHYGHLITYEDNCLFERIKTHFLSSVQDVFKYYDRSFAQPIYICWKNPENLCIKNR